MFKHANVRHYAYTGIALVAGLCLIIALSDTGEQNQVVMKPSCHIDIYSSENRLARVNSQSKTSRGLVGYSLSEAILQTKSDADNPLLNSTGFGITRLVNQATKELSLYALHVRLGSELEDAVMIDTEVSFPNGTKTLRSHSGPTTLSRPEIPSPTEVVRNRVHRVEAGGHILVPFSILGDLQLLAPENRVHLIEGPYRVRVFCTYWEVGAGHAETVMSDSVSVHITNKQIELAIRQFGQR